MSKEPLPIIRDCPFCEEGCCFCDYSGRVFIGDGYGIRTIELYNELKKPKVKKEILREFYDDGGFDNLHPRPSC